MATEDLDLMTALGTPEGTPKAKGKKKAGYLDGKSPELVNYLMDAVDTEATAEARAEALCRAIEMSGSESAEPEEDEPASSVGAGMPMEGEDY